VQASDVAFLRAVTDRKIKSTVPGPFTMSQQAQDEHYGDPRSVALAYAEAVNEELHDLVAAGADVVQLDEPWLQARPEQAREYAVDAIDRALQGIAARRTTLHHHGYAFVREKPSATRFLRQLDISVGGVVGRQPTFDLSVLRARTAADCG
jgi:5-methyltetrahydropteroyltriglutamate--homocysteine methyltransferase